MLACVVNVSEGRDPVTIDAIAMAAGPRLLDLHTDPHHHRSVLTLGGPDVEAAVRAVAAEAVRRIDLRRHAGVHPRLGAVDVVPFVPMAGSPMADALSARDAFTGWAAPTLNLPCFLYGPERALPEVRRHAFARLAPDAGPATPHPTAGAVCVGARPPLVAYNLWLEPTVPIDTARRVAAQVRGPWVRALALDVGGRPQVSMNLLSPLSFGPADAYDAVASRVAVARAELVGLVPEAVLDAVPPARWIELDLAPERTFEARLAAGGSG